MHITRHIEIIILLFLEFQVSKICNVLMNNMSFVDIHRSMIIIQLSELISDKYCISIYTKLIIIHTYGANCSRVVKYLKISKLT